MKTENKVIKANLRNITVIYKLKTTKHGNKRNYLQLCQSDHFW